MQESEPQRSLLSTAMVTQFYWLDFTTVWDKQQRESVRTTRMEID